MSLRHVHLGGFKDRATPPPALEVDHLLPLVPFHPDVVTLCEDRLHAGAEGHQDGDDSACHGEEAARGCGHLRPKDDTAVHPPEIQNE